METFNNTFSAYYDCANITNSTSMIQNTSVKIAFYILYVTIFTLGLIGNALVCHAVCRNKAMQTVTNLFIMNLALSDILLCVLAVPFTPLYSFMGRWIFGRLICHLVPYAQGTSIYISTLTLMSIAIDRYFVILYPLRPRMKLATCIIIIIGIWLLAMLVTLPYGIYMNMKPYQGHFVCEEDWPNRRHTQRIFGSFTTTMQFVVPFFVIAFCYICVSLRLNDRARMRRSGTNTRKEEADRERKKRTNRMLISMVTIFVISWLPLNVVNVLNDFYEPSNCWTHLHAVFFLCHSLAMSSTCYNPFLYAWLNENFRKEFKQVLPPCCYRYGKRSHFGRNGSNIFGGRRNGTETVQETLLQSTLNGHDSPVLARQLEPRDPLAAPILFNHSNNEPSKRFLQKEEIIYLTGISQSNSVSVQK